MRRKIFVTLILGLLALLVMGSVLKPLFPDAFVPNLTVVILVYLAFFEVNALGVFLAFMIGLEMDLCSAGLLGPWAGVYVLVYFLLYLSSKRIFIESFLALLIAILAASLTAVIFHHCFIMIIQGKQVMDAGVFFEALKTSLITALLGPFLIRMFRRFPLKRKDNHLSFLRN